MEALESFVVGALASILAFPVIGFINSFLFSNDKEENKDNNNTTTNINNNNNFKEE